MTLYLSYEPTHPSSVFAKTVLQGRDPGNVVVLSSVHTVRLPVSMATLLKEDKQIEADQRLF
jgi:hypothetical protein